MEICIRKENTNQIYIDKTALNRFSKEELAQPPYNFTFIEVEKEDCEASDFNDDLTFNIEKYNARKQKLLIEPQIIELKQKLADTDYKAIKYAEGAISEEEYAPIKQQRQAWRDEINELEEQLKGE